MFNANHDVSPSTRAFVEFVGRAQARRIRTNMHGTSLIHQIHVPNMSAMLVHVQMVDLEYRVNELKEQLKKYEALPAVEPQREFQGLVPRPFLPEDFKKAEETFLVGPEILCVCPCNT